MASGGDIIKEYVVSIRYNVDDSDLNKTQPDIGLGLPKFKGDLSKYNSLLTGFIGGSLAGLHGWSKSAGGIIGALGDVIVQTTDQYADLFYIQQKLSSTFKGPMSDLLQVRTLSEMSGLGPDALYQNLESVASKLRDRPAGSVLDIATKGAKDPLTALENAAAYYNKNVGTMGEYALRSILDFTGLSKDQIRQIGQNLTASQTFIVQQQKFIKALGFDPQQMADNSVAFQRNVMQIDDMVKLLVVDAVSNALPEIIAGLTQFAGWMKDNSAEFKSDIALMPLAMENLFSLIHNIIQVLAYKLPTNPIGFIGALFNLINYGPNGPPKNPPNMQGIPTGTDDWQSVIPNPYGMGEPGSNITSPGSGISPSPTGPQSVIVDPYGLGGPNPTIDNPLSAMQSSWLYQNVWVPFAALLGGVGGLGNALPVSVRNKNADKETDDLVKAQAKAIQEQQNITTPPNIKISSAQEDSNITQAVKFFQSKGLTYQQAVGVAARLAAESQMDPNAVNPTSGAYGIAQWLGPRKGAALSTNGDFASQLNLVWNELNGPEKKALKAILNATTASQAATAMEQYERAGDPNFTASAAAFANYLQQKLQKVLNTMPSSGNLANLSAPPGTAALAANGSSPTFAATSVIHIHGNHGPEIGAKVETAVYKAHSKLFRNFSTQVA